MVSGIVVAGGASKRMGRDKAWVELGGKFMIVRVIEALHKVCDDIVIVANERERFETLGERVVADEIPNSGSLGGLYSGLHAARHHLAVAVACDMPFLNAQLLKFLISLSSGYDIVIPSLRNERKPQRRGTGHVTAKQRDLHPLHAVYRKSCTEPMRQAIARGDLRMISFHDAVRVRVVEQPEMDPFDLQHLSFWNVNTPEELSKAELTVG